MAEQEKALTGTVIEYYERDELTTAWAIHYGNELGTRKYYKSFKNIIFKVYDWVYEHKEIIWDTSFEEQERMMIEDGVLTPEDI